MCTHSSEHTHREHPPGTVANHIAAAPWEQLGVLVPCSRVSPQSWYRGWKRVLVIQDHCLRTTAKMPPFHAAYGPHDPRWRQEWIKNSANCVHVSHTNEKQGTAVLFASQKPGCLLWFQTQPSSSRASPCTARIEQRSSQGKAEVEVFVSISTTHGVMKGTYTLLNPSAPLIWNFIRFCVDHSGYRGNLQQS